jgi:hypothetical protein
MAHRGWAAPGIIIKETVVKIIESKLNCIILFILYRIPVEKLEK